MIEQLIDLLDDEDAPTMEREPEVNEESDGAEVAAMPKRHRGGGMPPVLRLVSGDGQSPDAL